MMLCGPLLASDDTVRLGTSFLSLSKPSYIYISMSMFVSVSIAVPVSMSLCLSICIYHGGMLYVPGIRYVKCPYTKK